MFAEATPRHDLIIRTVLSKLFSRTCRLEGCYFIMVIQEKHGRSWLGLTRRYACWRDRRGPHPSSPSAKRPRHASRSRRRLRLAKATLRYFVDGPFVACSELASLISFRTVKKFSKRGGLRSVVIYLDRNLLVYYAPLYDCMRREPICAMRKDIAHSTSIRIVLTI